MSNKTVKLSEKNYNKLHEIKNIHGLKSIDQAINSILPDGTVIDAESIVEQPAFTIENIVVTWNELRKTESNKTWGVNESATLIYKDEYGALIRFKYGCDVFLEYYHFI